MHVIIQFFRSLAPRVVRIPFHIDEVLFLGFAQPLGKALVGFRINSSAGHPDVLMSLVFSCACLCSHCS